MDLVAFLGSVFVHRSFSLDGLLLTIISPSPELSALSAWNSLPRTIISPLRNEFSIAKMDQAASTPFVMWSRGSIIFEPDLLSTLEFLLNSMKSVPPANTIPSVVMVGHLAEDSSKLADYMIWTKGLFATSSHMLNTTTVGLVVPNLLVPFCQDESTSPFLLVDLSATVRAHRPGVSALLPPAIFPPPIRTALSPCFPTAASLLATSNASSTLVLHPHPNTPLRPLAYSPARPTRGALITLMSSPRVPPGDSEMLAMKSCVLAMGLFNPPNALVSSACARTPHAMGTGCARIGPPVVGVLVLGFTLVIYTIGTGWPPATWNWPPTTWWMCSSWYSPWLYPHTHRNWLTTRHLVDVLVIHLGWPPATWNWLATRHLVDVLVLGAEPEVATAVAQFPAFVLEKEFPTKFDLPLLKGCWKLVEERGRGKTPLVMYTNGDLQFYPDLYVTAEAVLAEAQRRNKQRLLIVGRRLNLDKEALDKTAFPGWSQAPDGFPMLVANRTRQAHQMQQQQGGARAAEGGDAGPTGLLRTAWAERKQPLPTDNYPGDLSESVAITEGLKAVGKFFQNNAIDYFIWTPGTFVWDEILDFTLGRVAFDNWIMAYGIARPNDIMTVDASMTITAVHINHGKTRFDSHKKDHNEWNRDLFNKNWPKVPGDIDVSPLYTVWTRGGDDANPPPGTSTARRLTFVERHFTKPAKSPLINNNSSDLPADQTWFRNSPSQPRNLPTVFHEKQCPHATNMGNAVLSDHFRLHQIPNAETEESVGESRQLDNFRVGALPLPVETELRSFGLGADGGPILAHDIRDWLTRLVASPQPACPAQALVALLECPIVYSNHILARQLIAAVSNLTVSNTTNAAAFGAAGIVKPLVAILRGQSTLPGPNPSLTKQLFCTVANLAFTNDSEVMASFDQAGVVGLLIDFARDIGSLITTNPDLTQAFLTALGNLAANDTTAASAICQAGTVDSLAVLATHSLVVDDPALARDLLCTIARLTTSDLIPVAVVQAAGPPLAELLKDIRSMATTDPTLGNLLLLAIANLASKDTATFAQLDVAVPLSELGQDIQRLVGEEPVLVNQFLAVIGTLAPDRSIAASLTQAGVVGPLARLANDGMGALVATNPTLARSLIVAIGNLAVWRDSATSFCQAGALDALAVLATPTLVAADPSMAQSLLLTVANLAGWVEVAAPIVQTAARPLGELAQDIRTLVATDPKLGTHLLRAIFNLTSKGGAAPIFAPVAAGRIADLAADICTLRAPEPDLATILLYTLGALAQDRTIAASFGRIEVIDPLTDLLDQLVRTPDDTALLQPLLQTLAALTQMADSALFQRAIHPLAVLVKDIRNMTTNPPLANNLLATVCSITDDVNRTLLAQAGVIAPLAELVKDIRLFLGGEPVSLAGPLLVTVVALSQDARNAASFVQAGVIAPLSDLATDICTLVATEPGLADALLATIGTLAPDRSAAASLTQACVVGPLARLANDGMGALVATNPTLARSLIVAIGNLAMWDSAASFCQAGVLNSLAVLATPTLVAANPSLAQSLLLTVANLAGWVEVAAPFVSTAARPLGELAQDIRTLVATDPKLGTELLRAIFNLTSKGGAAPIFAPVAAGRIADLAADICTLRATEPDLATILLYTLGALAKDRTIAASFARVEVIDPLTDLLDQLGRTPEAALLQPLLETLDALAEIADPALFQRAIRPLAVLVKDIRKMAATDHPSALWLLSIIFNITVENAASITSFAQVGVIDPLAELVKDIRLFLGGEPVSLGYPLLATVMALSQDARNAASFVQAGVIAPLSDLATDICTLAVTEPGLSSALLATISMLATDRPVAASFAQAGVIGPLARLANDGMGALVATNPTLVHSLIVAIGNLAQWDSATSFCQAGALDALAVLATPSLVAADPSMAQSLLLTVANLASGVEVAAPFVQTAARQLGELAQDIRTLVAADPESGTHLLRAIFNLTSKGGAAPIFAPAAGRIADLAADICTLRVTEPDLAGTILYTLGALAQDRTIAASFGCVELIDPLTDLLDHLGHTTDEAALLQPLLQTLAALAQIANSALFQRAIRPLAVLVKDIRKMAATDAFWLILTVGVIAVEKAQDARSAASFVQAGVIAPLSDLAADICTLVVTEPDLAYVLLTTIGLLAEPLHVTGNALDHHSSNAIDFIRAGVIGPLIELTKNIRSLTLESSLTKALLGAIGSLAEHPQNAATLARAGVVAPLIDLARCIFAATDSTPAPALLYTIGSLAQDPVSAATFYDAGLVAPLAHLLECQASSDNLDLTEMLLRAVAIMSRSAKIATSFGQAGAVGSLVVLQSNIVSLTPTKPILTQQLLLAIGTLASQDAEIAFSFGLVGTVVPLTELLSSLPASDDPDLANPLLQTLFELTLASADSQIAFGQAGASAALTELFRSKPALETANPARAELLLSLADGQAIRCESAARLAFLNLLRRCYPEIPLASLTPALCAAAPLRLKGRCAHQQSVGRVRMSWHCAFGHEDTALVFLPPDLPACFSPDRVAHNRTTRLWDIPRGAPAFCYGCLMQGIPIEEHRALPTLWCEECRAPLDVALPLDSLPNPQRGTSGSHPAIIGPATEASAAPTLPLKVLVVSAKTAPESPLPAALGDLEATVKADHGHIRADEVRMNIRYLHEVTKEALRDAIREFLPAVLVTVSHGEWDHLILPRPSGCLDRLTTAELVRYFEEAAGSEMLRDDGQARRDRRRAAEERRVREESLALPPQVVVLTACRTGPTGLALRKLGVPRVVGTAEKLPRRECTKFLSAFLFMLAKAWLHGGADGLASVEALAAKARDMAHMELDWTREEMTWSVATGSYVHQCPFLITAEDWACFKQDWESRPGEECAPSLPPPSSANSRDESPAVAPSMASPLTISMSASSVGVDVHF
ncbi:hypothetical protein PAPYR_4714 [Paratrimastix pyriformis]|uniref:Uncharacterized protein n=1 Tax=Paratrimastix pyriformis TaxID=342808 RepID=A0ABQ8UNW5_9EUKA|nr:hypothetical protein PAPYR_4714 [Paratrimastix pyriformis]